MALALSGAQDPAKGLGAAGGAGGSGAGYARSTLGASAAGGGGGGGTPRSSGFWMGSAAWSGSEREGSASGAHDASHRAEHHREHREHHRDRDREHHHTGREHHHREHRESQGSALGGFVPGLGGGGGKASAREGPLGSGAKASHHSHLRDRQLQDLEMSKRAESDQSDGDMAYHGMISSTGGAGGGHGRRGSRYGGAEYSRK